MCIALPKEEKLPFRLGNGLAPKAKEEGSGGAAEDGHMIIQPSPSSPLAWRHWCMTSPSDGAHGRSMHQKDGS